MTHTHTYTHNNTTHTHTRVMLQSQTYRLVLHLHSGPQSYIPPVLYPVSLSFLCLYMYSPHMQFPLFIFPVPTT